MRSDVFDEANLVEHHDLWDKGDRLQPETEAPHELPRRPARVDDGC